MNTNRRKNKYDKDPIYQAVVDRLREKGKGFFIISCGPWIHPSNKVLNCYAIMFDGFIQYKFELTKDGFEVAEIRATEWLTLRLIVGQTLTQAQLIEKIKAG
jgi:hypothetical protein